CPKELSKNCPKETKIINQMYLIAIDSNLLIFSLKENRLLHNFKYDQPILSFDISNDLSKIGIVFKNKIEIYEIGKLVPVHTIDGHFKQILFSITDEFITVHDGSEIIMFSNLKFFKNMRVKPALTEIKTMDSINLENLVVETLAFLEFERNQLN
ncbi:hypothetical protein M153_30682000502, partial [Pseudoloma neurophilia]